MLTTTTTTMEMPPGPTTENYTKPFFFLAFRQNAVKLIPGV